MLLWMCVWFQWMLSTPCLIPYVCIFLPDTWQWRHWLNDGGPWFLAELVECCFTSTETVGLLGTGAQDGHLDFHTAPELCEVSSVVGRTFVEYAQSEVTVSDHYYYYLDTCEFWLFFLYSLLILAEIQFAISAVPRAVYFRVNYQDIKSAGEKIKNKKLNVDKCGFLCVFFLTVFNVIIETLLDGNICQWFTLILLTLTGQRSFSGVRKRTADINSPIFWVELDWASAPASIMNLQKKMDRWPLYMCFSYY